MRILVAYDGSPAALAAVEEVALRPWPAGSKVRLVTVVEWPIGTPPVARCRPIARLAAEREAAAGRRSLAVPRPPDHRDPGRSATGPE